MKKIIKKIITILTVCGFIVLILVLLLEYKSNVVNDDYVIDNKTEICAEALEEIYRKEGYIYYLPCIQSENIYLKWTSGKTTKMIDDLNSGVVTIESLIKHGLTVYKKNESEYEEHRE